MPCLRTYGLYPKDVDQPFKLPMRLARKENGWVGAFRGLNQLVR